MKILNPLVLSFSLCLSGVAFSQMDALKDSAKKGLKGNFDERKAKVLENLTSRIGGLQSKKDCITNASDLAGLKKCNMDFKEMRNKMGKKKGK